MRENCGLRKKRYTPINNEIMNNSLSDIQTLIKKTSKANCFDGESLEQKFMLLFEEVGELAKSVRSMIGTKVGKHSKIHEVEEEASDVLYVLLDICNKVDINLEKSFGKKLKKIKKNILLMGLSVLNSFSI